MAGDWDLSAFFSELDGAAYRAFRRDLGAEVEALRKHSAGLAPLDVRSASDWSALVARLEQANARFTHLGSYLGCMGAADSRDELVQRETASLAAERAQLEKVFVALRAALDACDDAGFASLIDAPALRDVAHFMRRMRQRARFSMSAPLEDLAAELDVNGLSAWGRLYSQVSANLQFDLELPGRPSERLPVAVVRSHLEDPDPAVRRAALHGGNAAWKGVADVTAACLNAIAGTRLTLYEHRGVKHFLDPALHDAAITRRTLDTLMQVVAARRGGITRYLQHKARILAGASAPPRLAFADLMAPLPLSETARMPWSDACERVRRAFHRFSPALGGLAETAFAKRWIDHQPRPAKRPGGFCSTSPLLGESRVFMTYNGAPGDLRTLAHELGHAYHGWRMRDMRPWQRRYPMTLAESASTFAEQVYTEAVLCDPATPLRERAVVLDGRLSHAAVFLLNIPTRFEFEKSFYQERACGEVGVTRLCELMCDAQRRCYGEALDPTELNPWLWASTLHFYISGLSFYNFPYTFGYLFSLGLFARAQREGAAFLSAYDELLRLTGSDEAEAVARRCLGVDLQAPEFWNASIDLIEADLESFLAASAQLFPI